MASLLVCNIKSAILIGKSTAKKNKALSIVRLSIITPKRIRKMQCEVPTFKVFFSMHVKNVMLATRTVERNNTTTSFSIVTKLEVVS